jgi:hypothetical protein
LQEKTQRLGDRRLRFLMRISVQVVVDASGEEKLLKSDVVCRV